MNSPYSTRHLLTRADQIEINNQWRAVQRAIDEYWRAPITTEPECDICHQASPTSTCKPCRKTARKCGHPVSNLTLWGAGTGRARVRCKECERERGSRVRAARKKVSA